MNVEERYIGDPLTREVTWLVRTVFERTLDEVATRGDRLVVRVTCDGCGVACRAQLRQVAGTLLVSAETRPSMFDAVFASASGLARALELGEAASGGGRRGARRGSRGHTQGRDRRAIDGRRAAWSTRGPESPRTRGVER
jgi:hypothetical protein